MLLTKCSKVPNLVQYKTCTADLQSIREKNIYSQTDKIDLTYSDATQGEAQDSPPRKRAKIFDVECVIMRAELSDITINYAQEFNFKS